MNHFSSFGVRKTFTTCDKNKTLFIDLCSDDKKVAKQMYARRYSTLGTLLGLIFGESLHFFLTLQRTGLFRDYF